MFQVLIAADSRGNGLKEAIDVLLAKEEISNYAVSVLPESGATIESLTAILDTHLVSNNYHLLIPMIGVNNITNLHRIKPKWKVSPKYSEAGAMVDHFVGLYMTLKQVVQNRAQRMAFAPLLGINMQMYNGEEVEKYPMQQKAINQGVLLINQALMEMNRETLYFGPRLATSIHCPNRRKYTHKYMKLYPDGLHPTEDTTYEWAALYVKCLKKNYAILHQAGLV